MKQFLAALCFVFTALVGCSSQSASSLATGSWAFTDGSGVMLVDLPHGKLEMWQTSGDSATPLVQAKNLKIEKEERDPPQVTVSYDVGDKHNRVTLRIVWRQDGKTYNLAIVDQASGKVTVLNFVSDTPQLTL